MNVKWCFTVLVTILTLFGVSQHQTTAPNQEIVVQFSNKQVSQDEAQKVIANVKSQLELLGADNIQVHQGINRILKISYYSDSDVASIKKMLSEENAVTLGVTNDKQDRESQDFPFNNSSNSYNLDVYEIQITSDTGLDLEGIYVVEIKSENHRFSNPKIVASVETIDDTERIVNTAFIVNTHIAIAIDNTSHKIPEVRAGPKR